MLTPWTQRLMHAPCHLPPLSMFGMTQQHFQELNPGVPLGENPRGTVVCVKGLLGPSQEVSGATGCGTCGERV